MGGTPGRWRKPLAVGLLIPTLALLCLSFAFLVRGGGFDAFGHRFSNPRPRVLGALLLLFTVFLTWPFPRMGLGKKLGRLALMGLSMGLTLMACEWGLRYKLQTTQGFNSLQQLHNPNPAGYLHTRSAHPLLVITRFSDNKRIIYELKPNLDLEFGHRVLRTNRAGFRSDRDVPLAKPAGTVRIVGIGDSGMWGWNVDQGHTYMDVLERSLNQTGKVKAETLNFAVPGYNTYQELETLRHRGLAYSPDLVIVGWCENDHHLPFFLYTRKDHLGAKGSYLWDLAFARHAFLERVTPEVLKMGDIDRSLVDPLVAHYSGTEGVRRSFTELKALSEQKGFRVLVFGPMKEEIEAMLSEVGLPFYNTYREIPPDTVPSAMAVHFMHPSVEGHALLGERLARYLLDQGWL